MSLFKALDYIARGYADNHVRTGKRLGLFFKATRICNAAKNKHLKSRLAEFKNEMLQDVPEVIYIFVFF